MTSDTKKTRVFRRKTRVTRKRTSKERLQLVINNRRILYADF